MIVVFASAAKSGCVIDISEYVGWEIIYSGHVTGYINNAGEEEDHFEGCEWGRVLIVDYNKSVTCGEYNYSYAYRPEIGVINNGYNLKACIDDEIFDIRK